MYQILSRKYRPQNLQELIGQEVLAKTISNAIKFDRVPQTILLSGSYGIGKTTTARIIAKILNCRNINLNNELIEACNNCGDCKEIAKSSHPDVTEMDAASNTGVDNIRFLIENSSYIPSKAKYKIFIIDEVHMLSNSAFNALLKTLEEPPAHLKFIFATTELQKIPATILSRCQRFNLQKIPTEELAHYLLEVAKKENININQQATKRIAQLAHGSARDGLSTLDQIANYKKEEINLDDVNKFFNLPSVEDIVNIIECLKKQEMLEAQKILEKLYAANIMPSYIINAMLYITQKRLIDSEEKGKYSRLWKILLEANKNINIVDNPEIVLNVAIMQIMAAFRLPKISELLESIGNKELKVFEEKEETKEDEEDSVSIVQKYFPGAIKK